ATFDDGSCLELDACGECGGEGVAGCINPEACNYNPIASCDDGGCVYPPVIDLGEDVDTCEEEITLHAGVGYENYTWSTGETSESIVVGESGVYEVTVDEYNQNSHSLSFDGADDYMDFPDIAPELYTDAFTIMVHVYLEDATETDFYNILSTDDNSTGNLFQWGCRETDLLPQLYASNSAGGFTVYSSDTPLSSNQWCHIAISYSGNQSSSTTGELRFYTDGVETGVHSADIDMHASLTIVGHYLLDFPDNLGAREPWSGDLDDMQIWSFALSESEVLDYMNCPPSPGTDGVIAHWDFDEGQGDSVIDLSGNGFHGTLINGTAWSEELPPMVCAQQCSSSDSVLVDLFDYPCLCGDGTIWDETSGECVSVISSQNACGEGTEWDNQTETCIIVNPSDTNFDGCVSMTDLLDLLTVFGTCDETPWSCGDPLEYQGYDYETVQIGEQCWFAEDLRSTHFLDGSPIPSLQDTGGNWTDLTEPAYGYYEMENWISDETPLFNHFVVQDDRGVCPSGWKVPAIEDMPVGSPNGVWPNLEYRGYINADPANPLFMGGGLEVWYWSETIEDDRAYDIGIWSFDDHIVSGHHIYQYGFSIRCIQDSE
ncbi:MAG: LamG-like jellyroll fold domain-containing protein, partial [Flavobacteriales bacterium]